MHRILAAIAALAVISLALYPNAAYQQFFLNVPTDSCIDLITEKSRKKYYASLNFQNETFLLSAKKHGRVNSVAH